MKYSFSDVLVDTDRLELQRGGEVVRTEPLVFSLLVYLIEHRDRAVRKEELVREIWEDRFISDSAISSAVKHARLAIGDTGRNQNHIRTLHGHGFRFVSELDADENKIRSDDQNLSNTDLGFEAPKQEIKFCKAADGVSLAYSLVGEGTPIVKVATWMSHIEHDWHSPVWSHILRALVSENSLLRYDERGNGLSDWDAPDFGLAAFTSDLETVIEAAGLEEVVLFGLSQGCAIACEYAARHPNRVKGLVLYGGYCRGWKNRNDPEAEAQTHAILELARLGWGKDNPAFRQVFTSLFIPDGTPEQWHWYNDLQKISTTGENAVLIDNALGEIDVSHHLEGIDAPALVMHCRDDAVVPYAEGRMMAKLLANARFVTLPGRNHVPIETEAAWPIFQSEMREFLRAVD